MKNKLLIICAAVAFMGIILCGFGLAGGARLYGVSLNADGLQINSNKTSNGESAKFVEETKNLDEFKNLKMNIDFADVKICESDHFGIEYGLYENRTLIFDKQNDTMNISQKNLKGNFSIFSIGTSLPGVTEREEYVTLYVKKDMKFGTIYVNNEAGLINIDNLTADSIEIRNAFGSLHSESLKADDVTIKSESGEIEIDDIGSETLNINNTFGHINVKNMKADVGTFEMESSHFTADVMTVNNFKMDNSFGDIAVGTAVVKKANISIESGALSIDDLSADEVKTDITFGSTYLGLHEGADQYSTNASVEFGKILINGNEQGDRCSMTVPGSSKILNLTAESGDITLEDAQ